MIIFAKQQKKIWGGPGSGKSSEIIRQVKELVQVHGVLPKDIAVTQFGKKSADDLAIRLGKELGINNPDALKSLSATVHARVFRSLGKPGNLVNNTHVQAFAKKIGLPINDTNGRLTPGAKMMSLYDVKRARRIPALTAFKLEFREWSYVDQTNFNTQYEAFKKEKGIQDFTDLLLDFIAKKPYGNFPGYTHFFWDEYQDTSQLQFECMRILMRHDSPLSTPESVVFAYDRDQCIHSWNAADPKLLDAVGGEETQLEIGYRCPKKIHNLAQKVIGYNVGKRERKLKPLNDGGEIYFYNNVRDVKIDITTGSWLILAVNKYTLKQPCSDMADLGIPVTLRNQQMFFGDPLAAILSWERLRTSGFIPNGDVVNLYKYLTIGRTVIRGWKALGDQPAFINSEELSFSLEFLQSSFGLLFKDIGWYDALSLGEIERHRYKQMFDKYGLDVLMVRDPVLMCTIHAAKGLEADHVVVMQDLTKRSYQAFMEKPAEMNRLFYVACSRPRKTLHIIHPSKKKFHYPII